jgi:hypothetical protein
MKNLKKEEKDLRDSTDFDYVKFQDSSKASEFALKLKTGKPVKYQNLIHTLKKNTQPIIKKHDEGIYVFFKDADSGFEETKKNKKSMNEEIKIIKQKDLTDIPDYSKSKKEDDGQPRDNFYVPSIMTDIDVVENILDKFSKAGVTHKFSGSDLIITALTTSHFDQAQVLDDLRYTLNDVVQQLKKLYKEATGKTLDIQKEKTSTIDVVSNYTTGHMGLYKVINVYELPNSPSKDDKSLEKHEK